jgi:hypothetical protein
MFLALDDLDVSEGEVAVVEGILQIHYYGVRLQGYSGRNRFASKKR